MQVLISVLSFLILALPAWCEVIEDHAPLLGQDIKVRQSYEPSLSERGLTTETQVRLLGKNRSVMKAQIENSQSEDGEAQVENDLYVAGMRVFKSSGKLSSGGYLYSVGVAPTQIAWPLLTYPLGPVILQIDAGVAYQAAFLVNAIPTASVPVQNSKIKTELKAQASASGYLEGYAKMLVVRGGIGGSIDLVDGFANVSAEVGLDPQAIVDPQFEVGAKLSLLRGRVYGFIDTYRITKMRWKRRLNLDLFVVEGKCWALGAEQCETR